MTSTVVTVVKNPLYRWQEICPLIRILYVQWREIGSLCRGFRLNELGHVWACYSPEEKHCQERCPALAVASLRFRAMVCQSHSHAVSCEVLQVLGSKERKAAIITGLNFPKSISYAGTRGKSKAPRRVDESTSRGHPVETLFATTLVLKPTNWLGVIKASAASCPGRNKGSDGTFGKGQGTRNAPKHPANQEHSSAIAWFP